MSSMADDESIVMREAPTLGELAARLAELPPDQAAKLASRMRPMPARPAQSMTKPPAPLYASWNEYLARTTSGERRAWCARKAKKANGDRLMSGRPEDRITAEDVWAILQGAQGRCAHCGSLAVESRPSKPNGAPAPWEHVGRRIGSLGHVLARFNGGTNTPDNLVWSCLWCNTWPEERRAGATDHGAVQ